MFLSRMFKAGDRQKAAHAFYGSVVAQARQPAFYMHLGVPDSFDGRFEIMVLHIYLAARRLRDAGDAAQGFSQQLFDAFLKDMDHGLREAGVGDQTVPKRIAKMTKVFYGRARAYDAVLDRNELGDKDKCRELSAVIQRNLFPDAEQPARSSELGQYMLDQLDALKKQETAGLISGSGQFRALDDILGIGGAGETVR